MSPGWTISFPGITRDREPTSICQTLTILGSPSEVRSEVYGVAYASASSAISGDAAGDGHELGLADEGAPGKAWR
jgi:hypothetical protein